MAAEGDSYCARLNVPAPGWTEPRAPARRVTIVSLEPWWVVVESDDQQWRLQRHDVQAVRAARDESTKL